MSSTRGPRRYSCTDERLNEELRRRERVIRICPHRESATRLLGALHMEHDEQWSTGWHYFDMAAYWQWRMAQPVATSGPTAAPGSGAYEETGVALVRPDR